MKTIDIIGFVGAGLVLLGFYRLQTGKWGNGSFIYELDNLIGSGLLVYYAVYNKFYPSLILNVVWALVAIKGLESLAARKRSAKKKQKKKTA